MKARVEPNFQADSFSVWLYDHTPSGTFVYRPPKGDEPSFGAWQREPVEAYVMADQIEPSLRLPRDALEAIIRAAKGHVHAGDATTAHLVDATATRDRLLALIEKRGLR